MPVLLQSSETDLTFSVLDGKAGGIGQILLNRLSALNALTTSMCRDESSTFDLVSGSYDQSSDYC